MEAKRIEYICTYCGIKTNRAVNCGRPAPGTCTKKPKSKDGTGKPHTWRINRRY